MTKRILPTLLWAMLGAGAAHGQAGGLDTQRLAAWLADYEAAWEQRDADAAASLFTADAEYYETPYSEPFAGREGIAEYWAGVTAEQRDIDFEAEVVAVNGNVGVARWNAVFEAGGEPVELDGVFILEFDRDGLCTELREWWVARP